MKMIALVCSAVFALCPSVKSQTCSSDWTVVQNPRIGGAVILRVPKSIPKIVMFSPNTANNPVTIPGVSGTLFLDTPYITVPETSFNGFCNQVQVNIPNDTRLIRLPMYFQWGDITGNVLRRFSVLIVTVIMA